MGGIRLTELTKAFRHGPVAVDGVNLEIEDGEFMVLVGPSGCGKSTLLRLIAGIEEPTAGTVNIGERDVTRLEPRKRDIAMVFQNYALYPHLSVFENIEFPLKIQKMAKGERRERVRRVARILGLDAHLHRKPRQLSGGQRQRVAVGRAIVRHPQVFLFDEPLSNLDAKLRVQMRVELKRLHDRLETTAIYVTHDQVEAITLGDRIAVLSGGVLQQVGPPQEVYDRPANVFVAGFIGSPPMNLLRGRASAGRIAIGDVALEDVAVRDGDVLVGIRPEGLRPVGDGHAGPVLDLRVDVVEPLGDEVLAHGSVATGAGAPVATDRLLDATESEPTVTVRLSPEDRPAAGSTVHVAIAPNAVRLFDPATGRALDVSVSSSLG